MGLALVGPHFAFHTCTPIPYVQIVISKLPHPYMRSCYHTPVIILE